jgi:hypothetical protein
MKLGRSLYARPEIRVRRAVRRGAAWPAERSSSWLVVREAVSRWQVAHRRAVMVAKRRRHCPQEHGGVAQRAPAGRGGPGGADAGRAFVSVSVSSASVRSPVSGAGVPASRVPVQAAAVRCPVRASERPGVRCPAWVSSVRGFRVHCVRPGGCGRGGGADSRMAGMAGVGVVAGPVHGQFVGCSGRNLAVEAGVGRAGPAEASAWTSPSWWELVGVVAGSTAWGTGMGWMGAGIARWWRAGVRSEAATTLRGHRVRLRAGSPGRCEPPGLGCDLRVRPWGGRRMQ